MTTSRNSRVAAPAAPTRSTQAVAVADVSKRAGVDEAVVCTFAKISDPENKNVFSLPSAAKAFAHVKVS